MLELVYVIICNDLLFQVIAVSSQAPSQNLPISQEPGCGEALGRHRQQMLSHLLSVHTARTRFTLQEPEERGEKAQGQGQGQAAHPRFPPSSPPTLHRLLPCVRGTPLGLEASSHPEDT